MSDRKQEVLRRFVRSQQVNEGMLNDSGLTSRQLGYVIQQINDDLKADGIAMIEKKKGHYVARDEAIDFLKEKMVAKSIEISASDRPFVIAMMILSRNEELSLDHLAIELDVSKNTAGADVKKCKQHLLDYDLELEYSRSAGYVVNGRE